MAEKGAEKHQCEEKVYHPRGNWGETRQCEKTATVERDGKWYCFQHDPDYVEGKQAERTAKRHKELKQRKLERMAANACISINKDNPQAVAEGMEFAVNALLGLLKAYDVTPDFATICDYPSYWIDALNAVCAVKDPQEVMQALSKITGGK